VCFTDYAAASGSFDFAMQLTIRVLGTTHVLAGDSAFAKGTDMLHCSLACQLGCDRRFTEMPEWVSICISIVCFIAAQTCGFNIGA
jgi:hypothetical protein